MVSTITPPVALAAFAAAAIAKTGPMVTAVESTRVGIAKYLVPLAFAYNPSLLLVGPTWLSIISTIVALIGLYVLSTGLEGWYRGRLSQPLRFMAVVAAALMLMPPTETIAGLSGYVYWIVGSALSATLLGPRLMQARRRAVVEPNEVTGVGAGSDGGRV